MSLGVEKKNMSMKNNSTIFQSERRSWIKYLLVLLIIFHLLGYIVLFFNQKDYTYQHILIFTIIPIIILLYTYYNYVNQIEIRDDEVLFYLSGRTKKLSKDSLKFHEKDKVTRTLQRYKQLIIWDDSKRKVKIDSDDFEEYTLLKDYLSNLNATNNT